MLQLVRATARRRPPAAMIRTAHTAAAAAAAAAVATAGHRRALSSAPSHPLTTAATTTTTPIAAATTTTTTSAAVGTGHVSEAEAAELIALVEQRRFGSPLPTPSPPTVAQELSPLSALLTRMHDNQQCDLAWRVYTRLSARNNNNNNNNRGGGGKGGGRGRSRLAPHEYTDFLRMLAYQRRPVDVRRGVQVEADMMRLGLLDDADSAQAAARIRLRGRNDDFDGARDVYAAHIEAVAAAAAAAAGGGDDAVAARSPPPPPSDRVVLGFLDACADAGQPEAARRVYERLMAGRLREGGDESESEGEGEGEGARVPPEAAPEAAAEAAAAPVAAAAEGAELALQRRHSAERALMYVLNAYARRGDVATPAALLDATRGHGVMEVRNSHVNALLLACVWRAGGGAADAAVLPPGGGPEEVGVEAVEPGGGWAPRPSPPQSRASSSAIAEDGGGGGGEEALCVFREWYGDPFEGGGPTRRRPSSPTSSPSCSSCAPSPPAATSRRRCGCRRRRATGVCRWGAAARSPC